MRPGLASLTPHAVARSSAQDEFLAVGDGLGVVKVYSTGGSVSLLDTAIQAGELELFVSSSVGDD